MTQAAWESYPALFFVLYSVKIFIETCLLRKFLHFFRRKLVLGRNHLNGRHFFVKFTKKKKLSKFCGF